MKKLLLALLLLAIPSEASYYIPDSSITHAKMSTSNSHQISSSSGAFTITGATPTDVTNLTVTITTYGNPVVLMLIPDGGSTPTNLGPTIAASTIAFGALYLLRASSIIQRLNYRISATSGALQHQTTPPSFFDPVAAGTYTYKIQADGGASSTMHVEQLKLVAFELR